MAAPIELVRGNERCTVYDDNKANLLARDGWQRVSDLSPEKQAELRNRPPSPWTGYDDMQVADVLANAQGLPPERIDDVVLYESMTKGRVSIINKLLGRQPEQSAPAETETPPAVVETVKVAPLKTVETVDVVPAEDVAQEKAK